MHSPRRLSRKFEDLSDEWQDRFNELVEFVWAEPAHRRAASSLHLVEPASARSHFDQFLQRISATKAPVIKAHQTRRFQKAT
jgi:hypothetical protein